MIKDYSQIQPLVQQEIQTALKQSIQDVQKEQQFRLSKIQAHAHTGVDSLPINIGDLIFTVPYLRLQSKSIDFYDSENSFVGTIELPDDPGSTLAIDPPVDQTNQLNLGLSNKQWTTIEIYAVDELNLNANTTNISNDVNIGGQVDIGDALEVEGDIVADGALSVAGQFSYNRVAITGLGANFSITPTTNYHTVAATSPETSSSSTAITDGITGQTLILEGTSNTNTITIKNNANTALAGDCTLGINDTLSLIFNGTIWIETSRSNN